VVSILEELLSTAEFEVERASLAWRALANYRTGSADFSDYLIAQVSHDYDACPVHTLDRKAAKHPDFLLVDVAP